MCGRYGFIPHKYDAYQKYFELQGIKVPDWQPSFNIAPSSINPVITMNSPKTEKLMRWGLVPSWWKQDPFRVGFSNINARSEDIEIKPVFRNSFKSKRCLIPASFYFEWALTDDPKVKQPYLFKLKAQEIFAFAGVYDIWTDVEGKELQTYAIVTCEPNKLAAKVHNRMPVILSHEDQDMWADNSTFDLSKLKSLTKPFPEEVMEAYPVTKAVGNPRNNSEEITKPI